MWALIVGGPPLFNMKESALSTGYSSNIYIFFLKCYDFFWTLVDLLVNDMPYGGPVLKHREFCRIHTLTISECRIYFKIFDKKNNTLWSPCTMYLTIPQVRTSQEPVQYFRLPYKHYILFQKQVTGCPTMLARSTCDLQGVQEKISFSQSTAPPIGWYFLYNQHSSRVLWRGRGGKVSRILGKNRIYNEHPVCKWTELALNMELSVTVDDYNFYHYFCNYVLNLALSGGLIRFLRLVVFLRGIL